MDVEPAKAYAAIQEAIARIGSAPENEQLYIRALAKRCSSDEKADGQKLDEAYAAAMTSLADRYIDDLDPVTLSLEAGMMAHRYEWFQEDMPAEGTNAVVRKIDEVLRRDPSHPLANHLCIHILDSARPEQALGCAYRLGQVAPGLGHLIHMPSHIYFNVGDYEMAARVNAQAAAAERENMKLTHPDKNVYTLAYYMHDIHFVSRSRVEQGLYDEAKRAADEVADYIAPIQDEWPMFSDYYLPVPLFVLLRFQKWDDVLQLAEPRSKRLIGDAFWHFGRAVAFVGKEQRKNAMAEKVAFEQACRKISAGTMWMFNKGESMVNLASLELDARLAEDPKLTIEIWKKAVQAQDTLAYDEPPAWYYPIRESLGAALLRQETYQKQRRCSASVSGEIHATRVPFSAWRNL